MSKTSKTIAALGMVAALGVAALPFGAFALDPTIDVADDTGNVDLSVTISEAIALSLDASSKSTSMDTSDKDETMQTTATVSTNSLDGYTLTVKDSDTTTALTSANSDTIPTGTSIAAGTSAWGIKGGDLSAYTAMVASTGTAITVVANGTASASDETTTVTYGVSTAANQASGTYTDTITYTAAVK